MGGRERRGAGGDPGERAARGRGAGFPDAEERRVPGEGERHVAGVVVEAARLRVLEDRGDEREERGAHEAARGPDPDEAGEQVDERRRQRAERRGVEEADDLERPGPAAEQQRHAGAEQVLERRQRDRRPEGVVEVPVERRRAGEALGDRRRDAEVVEAVGVGEDHALRARRQPQELEGARAEGGGGDEQERGGDAERARRQSPCIPLSKGGKRGFGPSGLPIRDISAAGAPSRAGTPRRRGRAARAPAGSARRRGARRCSAG